MQNICWSIIPLSGFSLICGIFSGNIAEKKGYSVGKWFLAGFFFSIIGLIAAVGLPLKEQVLDLSTMKECPDCKEMIKIKAIVCKYCGHIFTQEEVDKFIKERS